MSDKQAVLLIHGIGEQRPMDTLRGFVEEVWRKDASIQNPHAGNGVWSKPDNLSRSFELRRLTTPQNNAGIKTDFFEFYWAHLMDGTSYGHVWAWTTSLLFRRPSTVPTQLKGVYWALVTAFALALLLAANAIRAQASGHFTISPWVQAIVSLLVVPLCGFVVLKTVGDAARYLHVAPTNVQRRHEVRPGWNFFGHSTTPRTDTGGSSSSDTA